MSSERPQERIRGRGGRIRKQRLADLTIEPTKKAPTQDPEKLLGEIRAIEAARHKIKRRMGHGPSRKH